MSQTTTSKNQSISLRILALVKNGMPLPQAYDTVMGQGAYMAIAGEVYDALRVK